MWQKIFEIHIPAFSEVFLNRKWLEIGSLFKVVCQNTSFKVENEFLFCDKLLRKLEPDSELWCLWKMDV